MSTTTPVSAPYLPGDRVRNKTTKDLATVIEPRGLAEHSLSGPYLDIHIDVRKDANAYSNWAIDNVERQPITPGCRVRWIEHVAGYITLEGRIVKEVQTSDWSGTDIVTFTDNSEVYAKDVVRIADPAPVQAAVTDFRPGDRIFNHNGDPGTVKPHPASRANWEGIDQWVYLDLDYDNIDTANVHVLQAKRQPIEPGCYVREVPGSNVFGSSNRVEPVLDVIDGKAILNGFLGGTLKIDVERLIRVAEPAPVQAEPPVLVGFDLASGPDRSVFYVYDPRKEAQIADLTKRLSIADNARLDAIGERDDANAQITRLADYIASEVPGEPSRSEGAVDTAIRVMRRQEQALTSVCALLRNRGPSTNLFRALDAWLAEYDPQPTPPAPPDTFKRGDLVTWGAGAFIGRIVNLTSPNLAEVIILTVKDGRGNPSEYVGTFCTTTTDIMRHIKAD